MCQSESPASNLPWQIVDRSEYQDPQEQSLCCLLRVQTSHGFTGFRSTQERETEEFSSHQDGPWIDL